MKRRAIVPVLLLALAACSDEGKNLSGQSQAAPAPAPAAKPKMSGPLPAGHPALPGADGKPVNPHAGLPGVPAPDAMTPPVAAPSVPFDWSVPQGWAASPPSNPMRLAQFEVAKDAEGQAVLCIVFRGIGGDDQENIDRWIGQLGDAAKSTAKITDSEKGGLLFKRFEAQGSYTDTMSRDAKPIADAKMIAAIVTSGGAKLHVRLVGPSAIVDKAAAQFDAFVASMKPR